DAFDLPTGPIRHTGVPHYYWGANEGESETDFVARRARELEEMILAEGPETVGAFIGEPVLGTGGIIPPPEGYWPAIQEVRGKYDIQPDLITIAKGLTSAYVPLSASIISRRVYEVMETAADSLGAFSHGYTYSGHPLGAAAAVATLDIVEKEDLPGNALRTG